MAAVESGESVTAPPPPDAAEIGRSGASAGKRIVYVQYTNPAGYPPLEHSSQMLADAGWEVLFLGAEVLGTESLRFPDHPRIRVRSFGPQRAGWRQKLHYLFFCGWCLAWIFRQRGAWVYASDLFSCPVAAAAAAIFRNRVIYHEHDSPEPHSASRFVRLCQWTRAVCARRARLCILPNARRAELFEEQTQSAPPAPRPRQAPPNAATGFDRETQSTRAALVIWNCPGLREVAASRLNEQTGAARFLYHGSIVPDRLPLAVVDALATLPAEPTLTVVGYETAGSVGYVDTLRRRAAAMGVAQRLNLMGPLARREAMEVCRRHDVGIALVPLASRDSNLRSMVGASNKPFDYLAGGLALLVSQLADWEETFVAPGYGLACDPAASQSIAAAMRWFIEHPADTRNMGEKGRRRILHQWNYAAQFQPALERIELS